MAALSLTCKQCNANLKSVKEAQSHGEATGHSQFEESTEPVSSSDPAESGDQLFLSRANKLLLAGAQSAMHDLRQALPEPNGKGHALETYRSLGVSK